MSGRPTIFSPEVADLICKRLIELGSVRRACDSDDMPSASTVFSWLAEANNSDASEEKKRFLDQYVIAQRISADVEIDAVLDEIEKNAVTTVIVDGNEVETKTAPSVWYARLMYDAVKWRAGRKNGKYSDKYVEPDAERVSEKPGLIIRLNKEG